jgi:nitrite reductase/ring-hydroxylating ferredoxin subunit
MALKMFTKKQIVAKLEPEGFYFREFTLSHEGDYAVDDADWNYKDVPHLRVVHELAESILTVMGDDIATTINTQKMFGMKFPLALVNYESGENSQTYYSTLFWFIFIIETTYEKLGPIRTRVNTTYAIGSPWWLRWAFPVVRWSLTRNYGVLMSADIPMRTRRGELRKRGFNFRKPGERHSFAETVEVTRTNVIPPLSNEEGPIFSARISELLPADGEGFVGDNGHLGLRLVREGDVVKLFPRLCPHEGACLDLSHVARGVVRCPWHGRIFKPIGEVSLSTPGRTEMSTDFSTVVVKGDEVSVFPISAAPFRAQRA